ncbi:MAG TPA: rhodanese-like domain-containing protein [Chitinophagaceae bacterium]|nr:rhodanese-like domain-containing protein [Chitinophagaceae bacterium]
MFIKQFYTGCLSEAAYYIESGGEAAVVDPLRDIDRYLDLARERRDRIKFIFETHFHADFISGHLDMAAKTGAPVIYGPGTETAFPIHLARDGEQFQIGKISLEVLHTPGHTLESSCYLLRDEGGHPHCLFTGDTLFVGDVGRPDLFSGNLGKEELAGMLFNSLQKLKLLPDEVIVYPAHGQGSSCGKQIGPETSSTIGFQKLGNYAMLIADREEFIRQVTEGLSAPPQYFPLNARINRQGYDNLDAVLTRSKVPLDTASFKSYRDSGAIILDTRPGEIFGEGFIPGALQIGLNGRFAEWAGVLVPFDRPVILITAPGLEEESIIRLSRVGIDQVAGYLKGSFDTWKLAGEKTDMVLSVDPDELAMDLPYDPHLMVLDVRRPTEFAVGHVAGALNVSLGEFHQGNQIAQSWSHRNLYVHCQSGYRSMIACSILKKSGIHNLRNVTGGFNRLKLTPGITLSGESAVLN